jgi:hypothetical protein
MPVLTIVFYLSKKQWPVRTLLRGLILYLES